MSFIKVYASGAQIVLEDDFKGTTETFNRGDLIYALNNDGTISIEFANKDVGVTVGFLPGVYQNQAGTPYADFATLDADWSTFFSGSGQKESAFNPVVTDDNTKGYTIGFHWVNTSTDEAFICVDASTGAAVWKSVTAAGGGGGASYKSVNAATYTLLATDDKIGVLYTTTGPVTIDLPAAASVTAGQEYTITDEGGNASVNNITIDPNGAELIIGSTTFDIDGNYNSITIYSSGTAWYIK